MQIIIILKSLTRTDEETLSEVQKVVDSGITSFKVKIKIKKF